MGIIGEQTLFQNTLNWRERIQCTTSGKRKTLRLQCGIGVRGKSEAAWQRSRDTDPNTSSWRPRTWPRHHVSYERADSTADRITRGEQIYKKGRELPPFYSDFVDRSRSLSTVDLWPLPRTTTRDGASGGNLRNRLPTTTLSKRFRWQNSPSPKSTCHALLALYAANLYPTKRRSKTLSSDAAYTSSLGDRPAGTHHRCSWREYYTNNRSHRIHGDSER